MDLEQAFCSISDGLKEILQKSSHVLMAFQHPTAERSNETTIPGKDRTYMDGTEMRRFMSELNNFSSTTSAASLDLLCES